MVQKPNERLSNKDNALIVIHSRPIVRTRRGRPHAWPVRRRGGDVVGRYVDGSGEIVAADRNAGSWRSIAHAEMLVMSARARAVDDWRLLDHTGGHPRAVRHVLRGAVWARLARIVYGPPTPRPGRLVAVQHPPGQAPQPPDRDGEGLLAEQSAALLSGFFAQPLGLPPPTAVPLHVDEGAPPGRHR